jgi:PAS domain S-box-containing protein
MAFSNGKIEILVVEDNPGDFVLIEEYLREKNSSAVVHHVKTFEEAAIVIQANTTLAAILLDLSLPDASGEKLVKDVIALAGTAPVIVFTGFSDREFGVRSLSWGVSDYLLKDELDASLLNRSVTYSIERARIAQQLKESEAKYRRLFHFSPQSMLVFDRETFQFLSVNEAATKHYGYTREEFLSKTLRDIWQFKSYEEYLKKVSQVKESGAQYRGIVQHVKKSGELIYVEIQSDEIDFDGRKARLVLATDITEKIKSEKALELSEQRFRALVQEGSDLIAILGGGGEYRYVSPASKSILGIDADFLLGKDPKDFIHENDKERVVQKFNLLDNQKFTEIEPFRFKDAEGNWRWIETKLTNMIHDPAVGGIVANSRDVTERIEAEMKIKESAERYDVVAKATSDIIWDWNIRIDDIQWNENMRIVLGYEISHSDVAWWFDRIHKEDLARVQEKLTDSIQRLKPYWSDTYRFRCFDGTYKHFFDRGFLIVDEHGDVLRMIGSMQDITRQKEEEHTLKLLESVITNASDAVMITEAYPIDDTGPKIIYVNDAFTQMTGYTREEIIGATPRVLQGPKSSREELTKLKAAMKNGEHYDIEVVNYKKDGTEFWIHIAIAPVADSMGVFTHWIAIERDITGQINYIKAIEEQNQRLREIAWTQSHVVRAPLARIMGLVEILPKYESNEKIPKEILPYILTSAHELDAIIRDIVAKTEVIYNSAKNES